MTSDQLTISGKSVLNPKDNPDVNVPSESDNVARKFEALLIFTMMKSMRASLSEDTLTGSKQQDMYREMMDREIAESIAENGDFGLQKMFKNQLSGSTDVAGSESVNKMSSRLAELNTPGISLTHNSSAMEFIARQRIQQE